MTSGAVVRDNRTRRLEVFIKGSYEKIKASGEWACPSTWDSLLDGFYEKPAMLDGFKAKQNLLDGVKRKINRTFLTYEILMSGLGVVIAICADRSVALQCRSKRNQIQIYGGIPSKTKNPL